LRRIICSARRPRIESVAQFQQIMNHAVNLCVPLRLAVRPIWSRDIQVEFAQQTGKSEPAFAFYRGFRASFVAIHCRPEK
jgi:hypothetical protein